MNIEIKLSGLDTLAEAINNLAGALKAGAKASEVIDGARTKSKKVTKADDAPAPEETPKPDAPAAAIVEPKPTEPEPEPAVKAEPAFDTAKRLILEISKTKGRPAAAAILEQFGATRLGEVPEDKLVDLVTAANAVLA